MSGFFGGLFGGDRDDADVTHESGVSRLCKSIFVAICVAPLVMIGGVGVLGWNERRDACSKRAIIEANDKVVEVGCDSPTAGNGGLVLFSCNLDKESLTALSHPGTEFKDLSFVGTGLKTTVEMYQCVEEEHSTSTKDKVGGGKTTSVQYSYEMKWMSSYVDSSKFKDKTGKKSLSGKTWMAQCSGQENPEWPKDLPNNGEQYAEDVKAGAFTLPQAYVKQVPLNSKVTMDKLPDGWKEQDTFYVKQAKDLKSRIGEVRVQFEGNNWDHPTVTALGNNAGGQVGTWTASDSWLCSGFSLGELRMGKISKDGFFKNLEADACATTIVLRVVGFLLLWLAFSLLFVPLEVAADFIPCIGPFLGDSMACVTCCVSCFPGLACSLGVAGCVWVFMRPMVGVPMLLVFLITLGLSIYFKMKKSKAAQAGAGPVDYGSFPGGRS